MGNHSRLRFSNDARNAPLLETFVGPLEGNWRYSSPFSPLIRDGDERVQCRNIIRYDFFPEILEMLPHDAARRAVIKALTDTENRLRVHLGLLLACLHELNYPAGTNRKTWWKHHKELFRPEYDPMVAASLTQDWLQQINAALSDRKGLSNIRSQRIAAGYQEQGGLWGGHRDFGEAFMEIKYGVRDAVPASRTSGVIWWGD